MDYCSHFKGKKITVMRIGLLGRGVGDAAYLAECGADVHIVDDAPQEEMQPSVDALTEYKNISFTFGPYDLGYFANRDMVLKGAGVPLDSPEIRDARRNHVPVEMSASLFARLSKVPIIGVTGTRGKSTVAHMIHHVLKRATEGGEVLLGLDHSPERMIDRTIPHSGIILGGNIRGVSNLQLLKDTHEDSLAVMELDSWQLQGFGEAKVSPHIAVFTNFLPDHLDYYGGDLDAYFADKAHIFLYQEAGDVFITTPSVFERVGAFAKKTGVTLPQEIIFVDEAEVPTDWNIRILGEHNRVNAALAIAALRATSLSDLLIREGVESFRGVPGRLQFLKEIDGVSVFNDNNATTPSATIAGLRAVADGKNVVLIVGGSDKGLNTKELAREIAQTCKHTVLYSGTGTQKLKKDLTASVHRDECELLKDCVYSALKHAERGDVLLFSPAFSSFGTHYKNEYDRNDQFVEIIRGL